MQILLFINIKQKNTRCEHEHLNITLEAYFFLLPPFVKPHGEIKNNDIACFDFRSLKKKCCSGFRINTPDYGFIPVGIRHLFRPEHSEYQTVIIDSFTAFIWTFCKSVYQQGTLTAVNLVYHCY